MIPGTISSFTDCFSVSRGASFSASDCFLIYFFDLLFFCFPAACISCLSDYNRSFGIQMAF